MVILPPSSVQTAFTVNCSGGVPPLLSVLEKAIAIAAGSFDMYVSERVPWMRPEDHAHMLDGLRKAGWQG